MKKRESDLDRTRGLLSDLGFEHAPMVIAELVERGVREEMALPVFLDLVLERERTFREERRVKTSLKLSGLPVGKTLEGFDFAFQRGVERGRIELLSTCEFVRRKENVLLLGPPGVGKTHLAAGLGVRAVQNGFSAVFLTADELIERMRRDEGSGKGRARRWKYMNAALLIVDELGFQALDRKDAHLLFRLVSYRYERGSTLITSNKSIREWPDMLAGDEVLATAILDRLLHHCQVVTIDGRSFRIRDLDRLVQPVAPREAAAAR
jgi:DNA replication protein DnaC